MCIEVVKEKMTPKEFWSNYREMDIPEEHLAEVIQTVGSTSLEYQESLANEANKQNG